MLKLILLRHAKTEHSSPSGKDFDRPLAREGRVQAKAMAIHLNSKNIAHCSILCSDAKRTHETFGFLQERIDLPSFTFDHTLYLASREALLTILSKQHGNSPILLIGHNDGLSDLASYLTDTYLHLDTCTLLSLDVHVDEWQALSSGTCTIAEIFRPV